MAVGVDWLDSRLSICFVCYYSRFLTPYASQMKYQVCYFRIKQNPQNYSKNNNIWMSKLIQTRSDFIKIIIAEFMTVKPSGIPPNDENDGWRLNLELRFTHSKRGLPCLPHELMRKGTAHSYLAQPMDRVDLAALSYPFTSRPALPTLQQGSNQWGAPSLPSTQLQGWFTRHLGKGTWPTSNTLPRNYPQLK